MLLRCCLYSTLLPQARAAAGTALARITGVSPLRGSLEAAYRSIIVGWRGRGGAACQDCLDLSGYRSAPSIGRPNMRRMLRTGGPRAPGLTLAPSAKVFQSPDMTAWAVFSRFRRWGYLSLHQSSFFRLFHNHFWTPFQKFSRFFKAETSDLDTAYCVTPSASAISLSVFPSMQYCRSL